MKTFLAKDRIPVPQHFVKRVIGPQGQICRMLSRDLGVQAGEKMVVYGVCR